MVVGGGGRHTLPQPSPYALCGDPAALNGDSAALSSDSAALNTHTLPQPSLCNLS